MAIKPMAIRHGLRLLAAALLAIRALPAACMTAGASNSPPSSVSNPDTPTAPSPAPSHVALDSDAALGTGKRVYRTRLFGGMEEGEYYVYIRVGTPPLRFRVQVDTGSALLFVPAVECSECTIHTHDLYDISKSSTASRVGCDSELCDRGTCAESAFCHDTCSLSAMRAARSRTPTTAASPSATGEAPPPRAR